MSAKLKFTAIALGAACMLSMAGAAAVAQKAEPTAPDCANQPPPATTMEKAPDSGSKNMGTTGESGGTRDPGSGSPSDKQPSKSADQQPETAKGLDPSKPEQGKPSTC